MNTTRLFAALIGAGLVAGAVNAQPLPERNANQEHRIEQGMRSGQLTPGEAYRLQRQQRSIRQDAAARRYDHGGRLTPHDRWVLQHRRDRASAHIYAAKHNGRVD